MTRSPTTNRTPRALIVLIVLLLTEPRHTFPQLASIHEHTRQIAAHPATFNKTVLDFFNAP